eukprot:7218637-Pyramimonas_sp.AAC.3
MDVMVVPANKNSKNSETTSTITRITVKDMEGLFWLCGIGCAFAALHACARHRRESCGYRLPPAQSTEHQNPTAQDAGALELPEFQNASPYGITMPHSSASGAL